MFWAILGFIFLTVMVVAAIGAIIYLIIGFISLLFGS